MPDHLKGSPRAMGQVRSAGCCKITLTFGGERGTYSIAVGWRRHDGPPGLWKTYDIFEDLEA